MMLYQCSAKLQTTRPPKVLHQYCQDYPPHEIYIFLPCPDPFLVSVKNIGHLATLPSTVPPQPAALNVPSLVMTFQITQHNNARVTIVVVPINFECDLAVLRFKLVLTLCEARQDTH